MNIKDRLKNVPVPKAKPPKWNGPESEDGITNSLIQRYLTCKERFRVLTIEGLKPYDRFSHRLEFGNMWHVAEEEYLAGKLWRDEVVDYCERLCEKYPSSSQEIDNWCGICQIMFPLYINHWKQHEDMKDRTPLLQEEVFNVPYKLPSGRVVKLRGKWDSVDLVNSGPNAGIWLQENKTKSDINATAIQRQLKFDLQTMLYVISLNNGYGTNSYINCSAPIRGVRYNVIKRPKHYQGKKETREDFLDRLENIIRESPNEFFYRWNVEITEGDIKRFKDKCFDPLLEEICTWYNHITNMGKEHIKSEVYHYIHPFGCYNAVDEGITTEIDEYILSGSRVGLMDVDILFPELED